MVTLLAIDPSTRETGWAIFTRDPSKGGNDLSAIVAKPDLHSAGATTETAHATLQWELVETGVIVAHQRPRSVELSTRISAIEAELGRMANSWRPHVVACGKPSVTQLPRQQEGIEMLTHTLKRWAQQRGLPLHSYPLRDIRAALLGRASAAWEELAYAVMTRWGLVGESKSAHEWNAIAVGDYHVGQCELAWTGA